MKKIISSLLACLLILGVVPVGLISLNMPASAEGEVIRMAPSADTFIQAGPNADKTGPDMESAVGSEKANLSGRGSETYLQFRLDSIRGKKADDLTSLKLRFAVIGGGEGAELSLDLLENDDWNGNITYSRRPAGGRTGITEFHTNGGKNIVEVDLTGFAAQWLEEDREAVSFVLSGKTTDRNPVRIASSRNTDPTLRPCLKAVTGDAEDPDSSSLEKARLDTAVTVSADQPDTPASELSDAMRVGGGNEAYLRFVIDRENIQGAVERATLNLNLGFGSEYQVFYLENNEWSDADSYKSRPEGPETLLYSSRDGLLDAYDGIDLTNLVSDLYEQGEDTLTLHITGGADAVPFVSGLAPKLDLVCSDDPDVIAVRRAAARLLGLNSAATNITSDLLGSYDANGAWAFITWTAYDTTIQEEEIQTPSEDYIAANGAVTRPLWFEGTKTIEASAEIKAGGETVRRSLTLTLPPEKAPNYTGYLFDQTLDLGSEESESAQKFEAVRSSAVKTRHYDGAAYTYRTLEPNGSMVLNLKCDPNETNYLTLRLWGGDTAAGSLFVSDPASGNMSEDNSRQPAVNPADGELGPISLSTGGPELSAGFVYATYQLPAVYTQGKDFVSLRLYSKGLPGDGGLAEQTAESRGIYAAYLTQSPRFDPAAFEAAGEASAETPLSAPVPRYDIADTSDMAKAGNQMLGYVKSAATAFQGWQVYAASNYPSYMEGIFARDLSWQRKALTDENWKDLYYNSDSFLGENLSALEGLKVFAYSYQYASQLGVSAEKQVELLDRIVKGIDFLCRAQGSDGGFYSTDGWIGGPERRPSAQNAKIAGALSSAGETVLMMMDSIQSAGYLSQSIDADADGIKETPRRDAWIQMLTAGRDHLAEISREEAGDQVTALRITTARLRFDRVLGLLGSPAAYPVETARQALDSALSGISPKGLLLGTDQRYPEDYRGVDLTAASDLIRTANSYYFKNNAEAKADYNGILERLYAAAEQYLLSASSVLPPDLYSAVTLGIPAALKNIEAHLIYGTYDVGKPEFNTASPRYAETVAQMLPLCFGMNRALQAIADKDISDYSYPLEDEARDGYAWTDETARSVVIKNGYDKLFLLLNWNSPVREENGVVQIKASNRMQFHYMAASYDHYGAAEMGTQGYQDYAGSPAGSMETLMYGSFGEYSVVMNADPSNSYYIPKETLRLSGVYKDLVSGNYYTFLKAGEKIDDSVIPAGTQLLSGSELKLEPSSSAVLYHLAIPVTSTEWKVSEVNGTNISEFSIGSEAPIASVSIKKVGDPVSENRELTVLCSIYDGKKLAGFASETIEVPGDATEYTIDLVQFGLTAKKGQKLRFFIMEEPGSLWNLTAKKEIRG